MRRLYAGLGALIRRPDIGDPVKRAFSQANLFVYRASKGRLWNRIRRGEIVVLTTRGRRSGEKRVSPLVTVPHGRGWALIGSNAGGARNPAWVYNLRARPEATLTFGADDVAVTAREVVDETVWAEIFEAFVAANEGYATYVEKTTRRLPIFLLTPQ